MESTQTAEPKLIELNKLALSPLNVRRTERKEGLAELKASILAHGLMQNLVVTAESAEGYQVIAGGRRFAALRALWTEGNIPADYLVPCQVVSREDAPELSLAENVVRVAMHPADEFEAFAALVDKGDTTAEVADRFGVTEKHVLQRLKLARVATELLAEYRGGELDLDCLMAFTVTDDRAKQLSVYRSLQGWQKGNARHIRDCLTEKMVEADSKLARFVGLEAYEAAGGATRSNLFGDEVYLEDTELLNRLASEKLDGVRQQLEADGWGWVEVAFDHDWSFAGKHGRIKATPTEVPAELTTERERLCKELSGMDDAEEPEDGFGDDFYDRQEKLEEQLAGVEGRIAEFVSFDPKKMKSAGCYVTISHDGRLSVEKGLVRKKDEKELAKANGKGAKGANAAPTEQVSMALRLDLEAYRLQVAQVEIAKHPAIAFDLLVFRAASAVFGMSFSGDGLDVRFGSGTRSPLGSKEATPASEIFKRMEDSLPRDWLRAETEAEQFGQFQKLSDDEKHALLAYCVATALLPGLAPKAGDDVSAYDLALAQTGANVADYWRPTKENYLGRLTKEQLLAIGEEVLNRAWCGRNGGFKKGVLVDELHAAFSRPERYRDAETDGQRQRLKSRLPAGMTFELPVAPEPMKAKKGKKAA